MSSTAAATRAALIESVTGETQQRVAAMFQENGAGLAQVERRIKSCLGSDAILLTEISEYLLALGGKRIRPLLALVVYRLFGHFDTPAQLIDAAAGIEMIHMATLLHDDIIDASPTRRHRASPFRQYGMPPTLLAGDFLLARAFGLCAHLDLFIIEETERACVELTEGETLEGTLLPAQPPSLQDYRTVVEKKTASLFGLAAAVGSHLARIPDEAVTTIRKFGVKTGTCFQMVDDILDITADVDLLGKPTGTDLKQKTPSLVNVLWWESGDEKARTFFSIDDPSPADVTDAVKHLRGSTIISQAREIATREANEAREILTYTPSVSPHIRDQLLALLDLTLERCQ